MAKIENLVTSIKVEIDAPASVVWDVLTDFESYSDWNSFCISIKSNKKIGDLVYMQVRIPDTDQVIPVNEYLVAYEPERLLSWEQRPTDENKDAARRDQYIEELGPERSIYYTTDLFLGLNADTIMKEHGAWVKKAFDQVARDVKRQAELIYAKRSE